MNEYVFLYKVNNTEDRNCVAYVDIKRLRNKELDCVNLINITGACYSTNFDGSIPYDEVKTILTVGEYYALSTPKNAILSGIIKKLLSEENQSLFEEICEEEKEYMKDEYSLNNEDMEMIFDEYYLDYRDRGILGSVFDNVEDLAYDEAEAWGYVTDGNDRYFNYDKLGDDLLESERYFELSDGRIATLNY